MIPWRRGASFLLLPLTFVVSLAAAAQDVLTVGTVTAAGSTVDVPVTIRDMAGTPLGIDRPAGSRIQAFSIKVSYSPASAVQSVSFSRAGITRTLTPIFETAPQGNGTASLVVSFDEATNLIPFTLNGTNQVAHLVFTLSASAPPSSSIALTLDPALTQLTDAGGTAATKESSTNGTLTLVDGRIDIPALSVSLSPPSRTIAPGGSGTFAAELSSAAPDATTVTLTSSNTSVATVPPSVTIPTGQSAASFSVTAVALGEATIAATISGSTGTANVTVADGPVICNAPAAPQLAVPPGAGAGVPYSVTWSTVTDATEYVIEESTDEAFAETLTRTITGTSASYTHAEGGIRYYYRIRARNRGAACDLYSGYSTVVSLLVNGTPVPVTRVLTVVGSLRGGFGSFFKTALQLYNPHDTGVSGRIVYHPAGTSGTGADPSLPFTLAPRKTLAFADLLPAMGVASGLGSADIITDAGSPAPVALARVFNDAGAAGTSGFGQEMYPLDRALQSGESGVLLAPEDTARFRLNIGIRTLAEGATLTITVRDRDGLVVRTATRTYPPTHFTQVSSANLLDNYTLAGGETLTFEITSGAAFVYGATTDNVTNDPSVQFAGRTE